jgi:hypothetical protein
LGKGGDEVGRSSGTTGNCIPVTVSSFLRQSWI